MPSFSVFYSLRYRMLRVFFLAAGIAVVLRFSGIGDTVNRTMMDRHFRLQATINSPFPPELLVVAVDDQTKTTPDRKNFAALIDKLHLANVVALDYVFDETRTMDGDAALAKAVKRHGRVVLPLHISGGLRAVSAQTQAENDILLRGLPRTRADAAAFATVNSIQLQLPYPALRESGATFALVDINADSDNVFRRPILMYCTVPEKVMLPQFALAIASAARPLPFAKVIDDAPRSITIGAADLPLAGSGSLLFRPFAHRPYVGTNTYLDALLGNGPVGISVPTLSYSEALTTPPSAFQGKVVIVGETRTGTTDVRPVATDNGLRGVELTAQIVASLLSGEKWQFAPLPLMLLVFSMAGLVPMMLYEGAQLRRATFWSFIALFALMLAMEGLFFGLHLVPDMSTTIGIWAGSTLFAAQGRAADEARQRARLHDEFAAYVAPEVVDVILTNHTDFERPRREHMAILFSDIRNFTAYTEANPPEIVQRQLNEYLAEMTEAVFAQRGFLDKFVGDAVMVLFDPFHHRPNPAADAILCALDMQARLALLNAKWEAEGLPLFHIGIGIHCGEVVFGNMSSGRRKTLTAIGDAVNLASRIEGATKDYKAEMLVSEAVKQEAGKLLADKLCFIDRGTFIARGRTEPTRLYEVVSMK